MPDDATTPDAGGSITPQFVDGFLAAVAALNAALSGPTLGAHFYSFDWIGPSDAAVGPQVLAALHSDETRMAVSPRRLDDWRDSCRRLARRWCGWALEPQAAAILADEFVDLMEAFLGERQLFAAYAFAVAPPSGADAYEPRIGVEFGHLVFELAAGRLLLEFVADQY